MEMQRRFGANARLVTLHKSIHTFPEDICLDLPLPRNSLAQLWRRIKRQGPRKYLPPPPKQPPTSLPIHEPRNPLEALYFKWDDERRERIVLHAVKQHKLAKRWKEEGKKIVCHYMGSDLRVRGIDPVMNALSDLNLTNESDHLLRHPDIHYIYIPFDVSPYEFRSVENERLRIIHSPTNRDAKGTELIIPIIERVRRERNIEFVLAEGKAHQEVVRIKSTCDIAIEQIGNFGGTGYGRNSLETLAMGIPTITEMTQDYLDWLPENPFVLATPETLFDRVMQLIDDPRLRAQKRIEGRRWVEKYHSYDATYKRLMELYREHDII